MRQGRALQFEALEPRKLLSRAHHAVAHTVPAVVKVPLALDGTLAVNESAVTTSMNVDGSSTMSAPVSGRLGALGDIHGVWEESVGALGEADGPDTIRLHDSKGTV